MIVIAGEDVGHGLAVMRAFADGKLYAAHPQAGEWVGHTVGGLRKEFRVYVKDGKAREYDE